MNINDVIALARAGYTRDEIAALAKSAAPEQQPKPAPEEQPKPAPEEQQPAPEQQQKPAPEQQQPAYDFLSLLSEKIDGLSNAIKAANILNSQMPEVKQETAQDVLASIIMPTYKKEDNK